MRRSLHRAALVVGSCYPTARALEARFSVDRSEMAIRRTCCDGSW